MFQFIDQYIEQAKPHLITARDSAQAYAERTIALLENIRDGIQTEDFSERRYGWENPQQRPGGIMEIERDQAWILELVTLDQGGTVTISENGRVRFIQTFTAAGTVGGNNLILRGGSTVLFTAPAGNLYVQFKVSQPKAERHLSAVFPLADVTPNGAGSPFSAAGRHAPGDVVIRPMPGAATGANQGV